MPEVGNIGVTFTSCHKIQLRLTDALIRLSIMNFMGRNSELVSDMVFVKSHLSKMVTFKHVCVLWLCLTLSVSTAPALKPCRLECGPFLGRKGVSAATWMFHSSALCALPKTIFPKNGTGYWRGTDCMQWICQFMSLTQQTNFCCIEMPLSHWVTQRNGAHPII